MFTLNQQIRYAPNRGRWIPKLKTSEIISPLVIVNSKGLGFKTSYTLYNPFARYSIGYLSGEETDSVLKKWKDDPLQLYQGCVNFAVFCAVSGLGLSQEHFRASSSNLSTSIAKFHLYYHVRKIMYTLKVKSPFEEGFSLYSTSYDKKAYIELCSDYGVSQTFNWSNEKVFSTYQGSELTYTDSD